MKRIAVIVAAALSAAACEPLAPDLERGAASPLQFLAPQFSAGLTGAFTHAVLPLLGNVHAGLAQTYGSDINESGWIVGVTQGPFDGQFFESIRATLWTPAGPQNLGVLPPHLSQQSSWGNAINDNGVVAGMATGENVSGACCMFRAFVWTQTGGMQALPLLASGTTTDARGHDINNLGHVAGQATDGAGGIHAVVWTAPDQPPVDLGTFGGSAIASAVNDAGQVVGNFSSGASTGLFLWSQSTGVQMLGDVVGGAAAPYAINGAGHVVGAAYMFDGNVRPFRWTPASGFQDLGLPPGSFSAAAGDISDAGHITVTAHFVDEQTGEFSQRAFLMAEGMWIDLGPDDVASSSGSAINEKLQVVGSGIPELTSGQRTVRWNVTLMPVESAFEFNGLFAPVDNLPTVNRARAGQAIPVRFGLGGEHGLDIFAAGYPGSQPIACDTSAPSDPVESTATAGASMLSYDAVTGTYTYVWKTEKSWAGTCRRLTVRFVDGSEHSAHFSFTR